MSATCHLKQRLHLRRLRELWNDAQKTGDQHAWLTRPGGAKLALKYALMLGVEEYLSDSESDEILDALITVKEGDTSTMVIQFYILLMVCKNSIESAFFEPC